MDLKIKKRSPGWEFLGIRFDPQLILIGIMCLVIALPTYFLYTEGKGTDSGTTITKWAGMSDFHVIAPSDSTRWSLQIGGDKPFNITFDGVTYQAVPRASGYSWSTTNLYETGVIPFKGNVTIESQDHELHFTSGEKLTVKMVSALFLRRAAISTWIIILLILTTTTIRGHFSLVHSDRMSAEMASRPHGQTTTN